MSWLGLDFGTKRTGVAVSYSGQLAEPLELVEGTIDRQLSRIVEIIKSQAVETVVIGQARSQGSGHPTELMLVELKKELATELPSVKLATVDETLSTKEAERLAREIGSTVDTDLLAACLILEQYLNEKTQD